MSDRIKELSRAYRDLESGAWRPRSEGLFPIPEYPEYQSEGDGMWSVALNTVLTTLRYLTPAALLTIFWGQQSFLFRLLKHIDLALRSLIFSSDAQRDSVLRWLGSAKTDAVRVERLDTVWRHGWLLCGVLDAAMPGACAGHPRERLSLEHAQTLAEQYLAVQPVFSRQELESTDSLSKRQEWKLAHYLDRVRLALAKLTPPVSKPNSPRITQETMSYTIDYIAKGAGLYTASVEGKTSFKIYPTVQQALEPGEIIVEIRGPNGTYGTAVISPILGKAQQLRQTYLNIENKPNYTENALPLTQGATYLRSYGKNDMNKTYFIPKSTNDIEIHVEMRENHSEIFYVVKVEGAHDISVTSRGYNIIGSPFKVVGTYDQTLYESFDQDDDDAEMDDQSDRRVVLRIVDFVTEKMLLSENGSLEKITDEEANMLITSNHGIEPQSDVTNNLDSLLSGPDLILKQDNQPNNMKITSFKKAATQVIKLLKVCAMLRESIQLKKSMYSPVIKESNFNKKHIPDIVNSTISDKKHLADDISRDCNIYKGMLNFSSELTNIKRKYVEQENKSTTNKDIYNYSLENIQTIEADKLSLSLQVSKSINNSFINDPLPNDKVHLEESSHTTEIRDNFRITKLLELVEEENFCETFRSKNTNIPWTHKQNKFMDNSPIKIFVNDDTDETSPVSNQFLDYEMVERPKTPVLKIITGDLHERVDSPYVDPDYAEREIIDNDLGGSNEFLNPYFVHNILQNTARGSRIPPVADFKIGAPVSLPPTLKAPSPEPDMDSIILATNLDEALCKYDSKVQSIMQQNNDPNITNSPEFTTPLPNSLKCIYDPYCEVESTFYSTDSNSIEIATKKLSDNTNLCKVKTEESAHCSNKDVQIPNNDFWDSAYVSIDDTNITPDGNNNSAVCEISLTNGKKDLTDMGPAERELWQSCIELNYDKNNYDKVGSIAAKNMTLGNKRSTFTPIQEESDKSICFIKKSELDESENADNDIDPITVAFAELNDIFQEYFPTDDASLPPLTEKEKLTTIEVSHAVQDCTDYVDSASAKKSDVMRRIKSYEKETISEVQKNATESVSASRTLQDQPQQLLNNNTVTVKDTTFFGEECHKNIVVERKKYWDEKIKSIEEMKSQQQKKKKISSKHLRHNDSLSKRRGKHVVQNFLNATETVNGSKNEETIDKIISQTVEITNKEEQTEENATLKLVDKWRKYWDEKLETDNGDKKNTVYCFNTNKVFHKDKHHTIAQDSKNSVLNTLAGVDCTLQTTVSNKESNNLRKECPPLSLTKQDIGEELFKAFETSPKRFFGTSRKNILDKIDSFLGKTNTVGKNTAEICGTTLGNGIVSSRISLFDNIKQTDGSVRKPKEITKWVDNDGLKTEELKYVDTAISLQSTRPIENISNGTRTKDKRPIEKNSNDIQPKETDIKCFSCTATTEPPTVKTNLKRLMACKSEMDIFTKTNNKSDRTNIDIYKSCDELPKINVKSFISIYENVTQESQFTKKRPIRTHSTLSRRNTEELKTNTVMSYNAIISSNKGEEGKLNTGITSSTMNSNNTDNHKTTISQPTKSIELIENTQSKEYVPKQGTATPQLDGTPETVNFKERFKMAKQFFQSLDELRSDAIIKPKTLNECEQILHSRSTESLQPKENRQKKNKKIVKAHSAPTSDNEWDVSSIGEYSEGKGASGRTLIKISEKFQVEDLFNDVIGEGKLSRQGSFRGIPHKNAVLATFRSMENISNTQLTSYDISISQLSEFAKENQIRNAQTYLTEYPYLPQTDPSKYHSRFDVKASGLISRKELLMNTRQRRNSVPDALRLNERFTATL